MIEVRNLCLRYASSTGVVDALDGVTVELVSGDRLGLFGPSGSGKTSLLRCIAGLEVPDRGSIRIEGAEVFNAESRTNVPPWRRPIGYVFQDFALWPHMTVLENVLFPLKHGRENGLSKRERLERATDVLDKVKMSGLEGRYPSELSGGQRQRVALARALSPEPEVLLMDEPLSSLDPQLRKQTRNELIEVFERLQITTIFVSHDHVDGQFMARRIGVMQCGKLAQIGMAYDVFMKPSHKAVAETLEVGAIFECHVVSASEAATCFRLDDTDQTIAISGPIERDVRSLLVRSDACCLWRDRKELASQQKLVGKVVRECYTGNGWCVLIKVGRATLEIRQEAHSGLASGESVEISVNLIGVQLLSQ